eukprot:GHVT01087702.1.p2 GENE.GHVT01087702.1~~GHVT01087702.1.p2  ORF type:complete len:111 (-),score=16.12 GHVT01087702.1:1946-2278(-)
MEHANGQRQEAWPHPSIGVTEQNGDRWHAGWSVRDLIQYPRRLHIDGRAVGLWYHEGTAYAMDANCYHAGGALENAVRDIEDIDGQVGRTGVLTPRLLIKVCLLTSMLKG